jgi:hypothetical protein
MVPGVFQVGVLVVRFSGYFDCAAGVFLLISSVEVASGKVKLSLCLIN